MVQERMHPPPPPSTPERALWDDIELLIKRLDRLIELFETWTPAVPGVPAPPGPPGPPGVPAAPVEVTAPWEAEEPLEIYKESVREAGTFYSPKMVDWSKGKRLVLKVHSTLDQSCQITAVGNIRDSRTGIVEIGPANACAAKNDITIGLAWDDWMPYIGCKIVTSPGSVPTEGVLKVEAVVQK